MLKVHFSRILLDLWGHLCRKELGLIRQNNFFQTIRFGLHFLSANLLLLPTLYATTYLAIPVRLETLYLCIACFNFVKNFAVWQLSLNVTLGGQTMACVGRLQV